MARFEVIQKDNPTLPYSAFNLTVVLGWGNTKFAVKILNHDDFTYLLDGVTVIGNITEFMHNHFSTLPAVW